jgi:hypothetical protein
VHGTGVYSAGVGPKGPALERFLDIKKKKKKKKKKETNHFVQNLDFPDDLISHRL